MSSGINIALQLRHITRSRFRIRQNPELFGGASNRDVKKAALLGKNFGCSNSKYFVEQIVRMNLGEVVFARIKDDNRIFFLPLRRVGSHDPDSWLDRICIFPGQRNDYVDQSPLEIPKFDAVGQFCSGDEEEFL